jgi:RNA polymerase primary sigma factor
MDEFNIEKGFKFITFAVWYVRRAINLYCINYGTIVKKNNISKTYHVISQATNKFIQREYRQPTLEELANILRNEYNVDIKDVTDLLDTKIASIDEGFNANEDNSNIGDITAYNSYSSSYNDYDRISNNDFNNHLVKSMLTKLPEREREIIKLNFGIGYDREYEIQEIAQKLDLTSERVRQIKNDVIKKFSKEYKNVLSKI